MKYDSPHRLELTETYMLRPLRPLQPVCQNPHQSTDDTTVAEAVPLRSSVAILLKNTSFNERTRNYIAICIFVPP